MEVLIIIYLLRDHGMSGVVLHKVSIIKNEWTLHKKQSNVSFFTLKLQSSHSCRSIAQQGGAFL